MSHTVYCQLCSYDCTQDNKLLCHWSSFKKQPAKKDSSANRSGFNIYFRKRKEAKPLITHKSTFRLLRYAFLRSLHKKSSNAAFYIHVFLTQIFIAVTNIHQTNILSILFFYRDINHSIN